MINIKNKIRICRLKFLIKAVPLIIKKAIKTAIKPIWALRDNVPIRTINDAINNEINTTFLLNFNFSKLIFKNEIINEMNKTKNVPKWFG